MSPQQQPNTLPANNQPAFPAQTSALPAMSPQQQPNTLPANNQPAFPAQTSAFPSNSKKASNTLVAPKIEAQPAVELFQAEPEEDYTVLKLPSKSQMPMQPHQGGTTSQTPPSQANVLLGGVSIPPNSQQSDITSQPNAIPPNEQCISPSREVIVQSRPPAEESSVDKARLNKVNEQLKEANEKATDYHDRLVTSEEKLSLAEREKIRLEEVL